MTIADESIYRIALASDWLAARRFGEYRTESLTAEGFIHCSTWQQVLATAERLFAGRKDLLLLEIDVGQVGPEVRYEPSDGAMYPHVYGPLSLASVRKAHRFEPAAAGRFELPADATDAVSPA